MGTISVYVDESGIIAKNPKLGKTTDFVISMVFLKDTTKVKRLYKKETLRLIKQNTDLETAFQSKGELKGSDVSEAKKQLLYQKLIDKYEENIEFGIVVLDNFEASENLRSVAARGFNFLIKDYLINWFFKYSKFKDEPDLELHFIIDERNVATNARATLAEYLNTELGIANSLIKNDIHVEYKDSKCYYLIQLADFVANSVFRIVNKHDCTGLKNEENIKNICCHKNFYSFPYHILP